VVDAAGVPAGDAVRVSEADAVASSEPALAPRRGVDGWAVAWTEQTPRPTVVLALVDGAAAAQTEPLCLNCCGLCPMEDTAGKASVASLLDGSFAVAWEEVWSGRAQIVVERVRSDGLNAGARTLVAPEVPTATAPVLATNGWGDLGIAWIDDRDGARRVYFRRARCSDAVE